MSTTHLEDADALGAGVNATQGSGMRWAPPVIHRMSIMQTEGGTFPVRQETYSDGFGNHGSLGS